MEFELTSSFKASESDGLVLRGVAVATIGPAAGHGMMLDQVTLEQLADYAGRQAQGVKSRWSHPTPGKDGIGTYLGRVRDVRVEGDVLRGDLHLSEVGNLSPEGRLVDYVLAIAQEDPEAVGLSVVVDGMKVYKDSTGKERLVGTGTPVLRVMGLDAIDLVDRPAANRSLLQNQKENEDMEESKEPTAEIENWRRAAARSAAEQMINASGLPAIVNKRLLAQEYPDPAAVTAAIETAKAEVAALSGSGVQLPGRPARISVGASGLDDIKLALEGLVAGTRPGGGVQPLAGLRELYIRLTGDYDITGVFRQEIALAGADCTTMADLVADALNKRVTNLFQMYPQWWNAGVTVENFNTLQDISWITLGGFEELPTVLEGEAYTELDWSAKSESATFIKKGGYVGITMEAIDKDDTRKLQMAPRALAQAAWMTLGKSIAGIFTAQAGTGPDMSDGDPLFHANHNNVGSTALSYNAWSATSILMQKQTELGSGEPMGAVTMPYLIWVPIDLEPTAQQVLGSINDPREGTDTSFDAVNPFAAGDTRSQALRNAQLRIIKCPFWTDASDWVAQANPLLYPSIGLGYRYGQSPEIFSVASPTSGLMFTNDTLPVKVRFVYGVGPIDWRGLYKHIVA